MVVKRIDSPEYKLLLAKFKAGKKLSALRASEILGIHIRNTRPYLQQMHQEGTVYIDSWYKPKHGPQVPVYSWNAFGDAEDAPQPKIATEDSAEYRRNYNAVTKQVGKLREIGEVK